MQPDSVTGSQLGRRVLIGVKFLSVARFLVSYVASHFVDAARSKVFAVRTPTAMAIATESTHANMFTQIPFLLGFPLMLGGRKTNNECGTRS